MKTCKVCGQQKPIEQFPVRRNRSGEQVPRGSCRDCYNESVRDKARERMAKRVRVNPEAHREQVQGWRKDNRAKAYMQSAISRIVFRCAQAAPEWGDRARIEEIYLQAGVLRAEGKDVHVDHVVPINGKDVCGLHVAWNLQILPGEENISKRNHFEEGWYTPLPHG